MIMNILWSMNANAWSFPYELLGSWVGLRVGGRVSDDQKAPLIFLLFKI